MGLFGEKYSREAYEQADADIKDVELLNYALKRLKSGEKLPFGEYMVYASGLSRREQAKIKLEELYGKGQKEAIKLNAEYERLKTKAIEAIADVARFEEEKLGMKEGEDENETQAHDSYTPYTPHGM